MVLPRCCLTRLATEGLDVHVLFRPGRTGFVVPVSVRRSVLRLPETPGTLPVGPAHEVWKTVGRDELEVWEDDVLRDVGFTRRADEPQK